MKSWQAIAWALAILVLSLMPSSDESLLSQWSFPHLDKVLHAGVYGILGFLSARAITNTQAGIDKRKLLAIFALIGIYGIMIEFLQHYVSTGRLFEVWDIMANIGGAAIGIAVFIKSVKFK